jgi:F0F1-type ATP synthase delta subunit
MSSVTTLARPYAKAAFALAQEGQALARWDEMLNLAAAIATNDTMAELLESPQLSSAGAAAMIGDMGGEALDGRFRDFLAVLADNGRLQLLPEITRLFQRLRARHRTGERDRRGPDRRRRGLRRRRGNRRIAARPAAAAVQQPRPVSRPTN